MVTKNGHTVTLPSRIIQVFNSLHTSYSFSEFVHMAVREALDKRMSEQSEQVLEVNNLEVEDEKASC